MTSLPRIRSHRHSRLACERMKIAEESARVFAKLDVHERPRRLWVASAGRTGADWSKGLAAAGSSEPCDPPIECQRAVRLRRVFLSRRFRVADGAGDMIQVRRKRGPGLGSGVQMSLANSLSSAFMRANFLG